MGKYKYVIASNRIPTGGVLVLHNLCRILNELGCDAKILYLCDGNYESQSHFAFWGKWIFYQVKITIKYILESVLGSERMKGFFDCPFRKTRRKFTPFIGRNTIAVYSETVLGNPLHADNVVRWLLFFNSLYKQEGEKTIGYDKDDLFFAYREVFNDPKLNPKCRICFTPFFDLNTYKQTEFGERNGKCYVLKKGNWRVKAEDIADGIVVDDLSEHEKVHVFNECEFCISFDTQTIYSSIAAMCGCISVVVPEEGKTREDYRPNGEIEYGVAFGFSEEEIQFAISTRDKLIKHYKSLNIEGENQAQNFIDECENYFKQKGKK